MSQTTFCLKVQIEVSVEAPTLAEAIALLEKQGIATIPISNSAISFVGYPHTAGGRAERYPPPPEGYHLHRVCMGMPPMCSEQFILVATRSADRVEPDFRKSDTHAYLVEDFPPGTFTLNPTTSGMFDGWRAIELKDLEHGGGSSVNLPGQGY